MKGYWIVIIIILGGIITLMVVVNNRNKKKLVNLKQSAIQAGVVNSAEVEGLNLGEVRLLLKSKGWSDEKIDSYYK